MIPCSRRVTQSLCYGCRRGFSSGDSVKIVEVGPRDGLQNIKTVVPTDIKVNLIDRLSGTGLQFIEATSFVSPKWIPQLADNRDVLSGILRKPGVSYSALVPNLHGLESAIECGIKEVEIFTAASETFCRRNTNCTIEESFERFREVIEVAKRNGVKVRCAVSCVVGCPYEGAINPDKVAIISKRLVDMGCYEISLGDTIGVGTVGSVGVMLGAVTRLLPPTVLALHCHDTYGQALANCAVGLRHGVRAFDSSVSGLGGCPYAAGATGNVATEDLVYMLHGSGYSTGVDLEQLIGAGEYISHHLGRVNLSRVATAALAKRK